MSKLKQVLMMFHVSGNSIAVLSWYHWFVHSPSLFAVLRKTANDCKILFKHDIQVNEQINN